MLFENDFKTILHKSTGEFRDRGSKFIGYAYPVVSVKQVKEIVNAIKKEHPKANHHCYAFRLGPGKNIYRFSDDREPSGSAGKPIFGVIQSNDLTDILIIVVRYFGGTLLGVSGLINAYRSAAKEAIDKSEIVTKAVVERYELEFTFDFINEVKLAIRSVKAVILNQEIADKCLIAVEVEKINANELLDKIKTNHLLKDHVKIKVV
jgi:uncharacterized YigZ family protein